MDKMLFINEQTTSLFLRAKLQLNAIHLLTKSFQNVKISFQGNQIT